jgi:hypothetical protein
MLTARGGVGRKVVEPETLLIAAGAREAARVRSDRAERGAEWTLQLEEEKSLRAVGASRWGALLCSSPSMRVVEVNVGLRRRLGRSHSAGRGMLFS